MLVLIFNVEELGHARAVMGHDEVAYDSGQILTLSHFHALDYVIDDDASALLVVEVVVRVDTSLILGEEYGIGHFADVVIQSTGTHEQRVGTNLIGYLSSQITYSDGVLECARSNLREVAQQSAVGVGQLKQRHARHESEHLLDDVHQRIGEQQQHTVHHEVVVHVVVHDGEVVVLYHL